MQLKNNKLIQWWVTPKLPIEDIWAPHSFVSKWIAHPIKRRVARLYLKFLQRFCGIKVIGITGSSGKTTTTQMLASILKLKGKTVWSREGVDSVYNIPNMILRCSWNTKYLILEMSVEYIGEMDFYLWLARPDIGVITNIFPTHLEFLRDINGVLNEKAKLVLNLSKSDTAVLNSNDSLLRSLKSRIKSKIIWFQDNGNLLDCNASCARTVADSLNIPKMTIDKGLASYKNPVHRLSLIKTKSGAFVLDDSYNSNPEALSSALKYFVKIAGKNKKIAVLGDMKELGKFEEELHRKSGREISKLGFVAVIGVGNSIKYLISEIGKSVKTNIVSSQEMVLPLIKPYLEKGNYILIKGSRSIGLDKLVDALV